jgi:hypothetical protein
MDMPTTMLKMIIDDLMIMNDLEANSGVTSWYSFGTILAAFYQNTLIWNCSLLATSAAVSPS